MKYTILCVIFAVFLGLLMFHTSLASFSYFTPVINNNASSTFSISSTTLDSWWNAFNNDNHITGDYHYYINQYPATSSPGSEGIFSSLDYSNYLLDIGTFPLWIYSDNGPYWFEISFATDTTEFYTSFFKDDGGWHSYDSQFNIYPTAPEACASTTVSGGYYNLSGAYSYVPIAGDLSATFLISLWDSANNNGYNFPVAIRSGVDIPYSLPIQIPNGSYKITYNRVLGQATLDENGLVHFDNAFSVVFPDNSLSICNATTTLQMDNSSFATTSYIGSYTGPVFTGSSTSGIVSTDEVGQFISEWTNKFISFLHSRFPFNYLLTFTDWILGLSYVQSPSTASMSALPFAFNFGSDGGSFVAHADSNILNSAFDTETNVGNENTHTVGYWLRLISKLFIFYCLIDFSWNYIQWLFFSSKEPLGFIST